MNFLQAVNEVVETIKRPDKISTCRREVNAAISFYCLDNEFARDYVEQSVVLDPQQYTQSFSLTDLTRFRKFKYLKRGGTKCFLSLSTPAKVASGDDCDSYYEVGSAVNISLKKLAATLDVGFYQHPPILTDDDGIFWLLDVAPFMVIDRACAAMFRVIGDEKSMQAHMISAREAYIAARKDLGIANQ
jgi:hypothetical protein